MSESNISNKLNKSKTHKNSLAIKMPKLTEQWHPIKNQDLTPNDVSTNSRYKTWWYRKECRHEWQAKIYHRSEGSDCPFCFGQSVDNTNSLATQSPQLAQEWHPTKNKNLTPNDVRQYSGRKVWWYKRECRHEWEATIQKRSLGRDCPYCSGSKVDKSNSLATQSPQLAQEWHPTKNKNLTSNDVTKSSNKKVWWYRKECNHEWQATINNRSQGRGCPYCSNRLLSLENCLSKTFPEISEEWHPIKNENLKPTNVMSGSGRKVWWLGKKCNHEWKAKIYSRSNGAGCPYCRVLKTQNKIREIIQDFFPGLIIESNYWHDNLRFKKSNRRMQLDIFVPEINLAIEYQGEQHFQPIFGNKNLTELQKRDKEKKIACKKNNIKLLYVNYTWNGEKNFIIDFLQKNSWEAISKSYNIPKHPEHNTMTNKERHDYYLKYCLENFVVH